MNNEKITIQKDGESIECDILFTFDCNDTLKTYIGYTDNSIGANNRKNIYVSAFDPVLGPGYLEDIKDPSELDMLEDVLLKIDKESKA